MGQQQKWFDPEHALWFKEDQTDRNEGLAEVLSSLLLEHSNAEHICYSMKACWEGHHLSTGCQSPNFRDPDEFEISIRSLLPPHCLVSLAHDNLPLRQQFRLLWNESVQALQRQGFLIDADRVKQYLLHAFTVDSLVLNSDRHLGNLMFLLNPQTMTARTAPLFDHGGALCVDTRPEMFPLSLSAEHAERMAFLGTFQDSDPEHTARMIQELLEEDPRDEFRLVLHDVPDLSKQLQSLDLRCYGTDLPDRTIALLLRRLEKLEGKLWWSSSAP